MRKISIVALLLVLALSTSLIITGCNEMGSSPTNSKESGDIEAGEKGKESQKDDKGDEIQKNLAEKQELRLMFIREIKKLDPQLGDDIRTLEFLQDILEGLVRINEDGEVEKGSGLAKGWDISEDGKVYTFYLREALWSDGVPITAEDFVYSWKRLLNPESEANYDFLAYDIENAKEYNEGDIKEFKKVGVKALDKNTLEVRLKAPNSIFINKLQHVAFYPSRKDIVGKYGDEYGLEKDSVPSCGPFKVEEWREYSRLVLVKNPLYWDADTVKLQKIDMKIIKHSSSRFAMYRNGRIDYQDIPAQFLEEYQDQLQIYYEGSSYYYVFNTENKYVSSPKIRKAIRMAIDQTSFHKKHHVTNLRESAYAFVPPGIKGYDGKTFREIAGMRLFNDIGTGATREEIRKLVEEGLAEQEMTIDDIQNEITYLTSDEDYSIKLAKEYQKMIEENAGIEISIEATNSTARYQKREYGNFNFMSAGWIADYNDPMTFMDVFVSESSYNYTRFSNEEYDEYIAKAKKSFDSKVRIDSMVEAEKILVESMAIAPKLYTIENYAQRQYLKNIVRLPIQIHRSNKWAYILEH